MLFEAQICKKQTKKVVKCNSEQMRTSSASVFDMFTLSTKYYPEEVT